MNTHRHPPEADASPARLVFEIGEFALDCVIEIVSCLLEVVSNF